MKESIMAHSKHFLISVLALLFSTALHADSATVEKKVPQELRSTITAGGAGIGAALVSLLCVTGCVGTIAQGISSGLQKDAMKSFFFLNFTALFLYTALQTGKYSIDTLKRIAGVKGVSHEQ
jgi:hypothetical protein